MSFTFRLSPTRKQSEKVQWTLERLRELCNAALQERREMYTYTGQGTNYNAQANQLPEIKDIREEYKEIHSQVLQDTLRRVEKEFQAFFRRVKNHETPGFPRFQGRERFDSFTYPQAGFSLTHDNRGTLSKIGNIKIKMHRELHGNVKTCTIKREGEHWYCCLACGREEAYRKPSTDECVGIDLGVSKFATLSTGDVIANPKHSRKAEKKLATAQQTLSRKKRGSHRRKKAVKVVARLHRKVRNQRSDYLHKHSRWLVDTYETIVFEDIAPSNLARRAKPKQDENGTYLPNGGSTKSGLNKSIVDAGWNQFITICEYKAACAGFVQVVKGDPKYTSQVCSKCGAIRKKTLDERWHSCECGAELDRDHNAAINRKALWLGRSLQQASAR